MSLLDFLFPKYCISCRALGSYICSNCFTRLSFAVDTVCPVCNRPSLNGMTHPKCQTSYSIDGVAAGYVYKSVIKRLLYQMKYEPYISDLSKIAGKLLYESLIQNESFSPLLYTYPRITFVPITKKRQKRRGYNHAEKLAREFSKSSHTPLLDILVRTKETKPQFRLRREERHENIKDAFQIDITRRTEIKGKTIILVDDIATSFVTLRECAKVLKRSGAKVVWGAVLAREEWN